MFPAAGDATALRASFEMTFLIGWAPDANQPAPQAVRRPG